VAGDVRNRLDSADIEAGDLLAASHLHRYEFAARMCEGRRVLDLCCGSGYGARILARMAASVHGVDISAEAIEAARRDQGAGDSERVTFECQDALAYVRALAGGRFDVIVCFEGIEHVSDPSALIADLARLAETGTALLLSLPNSRGFDEQNEFHVTDYGYEEMREVSESFDDALVLSQYLAEASLIAARDADLSSELTGRLVDVPDGEPWANHWLILVGLDGVAASAASADLTLAAAANHNDYMRTLERANAELHRTNQRLARGWLGVHDAAAASAEARQRKVDELTRELGAERSAHRALKLQYEATLSAPRYRAVDAVRTFAFTIPGLASLLGLRSRLIGRRARGDPDADRRPR
jgi:SAM-dependent methyltransferase